MKTHPWYFRLIPNTLISLIEERLLQSMIDPAKEPESLFVKQARISPAMLSTAARLQKPFRGLTGGRDGFSTYDRFRINTFGSHRALVIRLNQIAERYNFDQQTADELYEATDQLGSALFILCGSWIHPLRRDLTGIVGPVPPFTYRQDWREEEGGDQ